MLKHKVWHTEVIFAIFVFMMFVIAVTLSSAQTLDKGKTLYNSYCIHCHGLTGGGDGPAAGELNPKPRNFQDPVEMSSVTPERMERAIVEGRRGTAMKGWSTILRPEDVKDLIEYIKSLMNKGQ